MKRWLFRISLLLLTLAVILGVSVQIALRTDLPRRVVLNELQQQTGLRIQAGALRTGWAGDTIIDNLTIALPLEADPFLTVPRVKVSHTNLIMLALTRRVEIFSVEVDRPAAEVKPDDRGAWNVLVTLDLIARAQGPIDPRGPEIGVLPRIIVRDARFDIEGPDGALVRYEPLAIVGTPDGPLAWRFEVSVQPHVVVIGSVAPHASWEHTFTFDVDEIPNLVEPWLPDLPDPLRLAGEWRGQVSDATLSGQLKLRELLAADANVHGEIDVKLDGRELVLKPTDVRFSMVRSPVQTVRVSGGTIRTDGRRFNVDRLMAEALDTIARLTAEFDRDEEEGHLRIVWRGGLDHLAIEHEGAFSVDLDLPLVGRRSMTGSLMVNGRSPYGTWDSVFDLDISGHEWNRLNGRIAAKRLIWVDELGEVDLTGLAARIAGDWPTLTLTHLSIPDAKVHGNGRVNMETLDWRVDVHARDWMLPRRIREYWQELSSVEVAIVADGTGQRVNALDARFAAAPHDLHVTGRYWPDDEMPLQAVVEATMHIAAESEDEFAAQIEAHLFVAGSVKPLQLDLHGNLRGRDVQLLGKDMRPIDLPWRGTLDELGLRFAADEFALADGFWKADGRFGLDDRLLEFSLSGKEMSIARLIELADLPLDLTGRVDAHLSLVLPRFDFDRIEADGTWAAHDLTGHTLTGAHGNGHITLQNQLARLHGMTLTQNGADVSEGNGSVTGDVWIDLKQKDFLHLNLTMRGWMTDVSLAQAEGDGVTLPGSNAATAVTDGSASLRVHLIDLTAQGEMDVTMDLLLRGGELGRVTFDGRIDGRDLHMTHFAADAFGGQLDGQGTIVLLADRWQESTIDLDWTGVNLAQVSRHVPALESLRGISRGNLSMRRADAGRPPEPMRVDVVMDIDDGAFDALTIQSLVAEAYVGPNRAIMERLRVHVADGTLDLWGRLSRHHTSRGRPWTDELFLHGQVTMDRLDLDQVVRAARLADEPNPGRISGSGSAGGYPFNAENHRLFGTAQLHLTESDIVSLPGIDALYSALRLDLGTPDLSGEGTATVRLEGDALEITPLTYFNRGVDVAARLRIDNVWLREDSPIRGIAVGVVRPLKDSDLPLAGRLDRLLGAVQTDAASVRIGGTLAEREVEFVPLADITGAIGRILRGTPD